MEKTEIKVQRERKKEQKEKKNQQKWRNKKKHTKNVQCREKEEKKDGRPRSCTLASGLTIM